LWYTISRTKLGITDEDFWLTTFTKLSTMWEKFMFIDPNYITPKEDKNSIAKNRVFIDEIPIF
jgi:hypothetical protein